MISSAPLLKTLLIRYIIDSWLCILSDAIKTEYIRPTMAWKATNYHNNSYIIAVITRVYHKYIMQRKVLVLHVLKTIDVL